VFRSRGVSTGTQWIDRYLNIMTTEAAQVSSGASLILYGSLNSGGPQPPPDHVTCLREATCRPGPAMKLAHANCAVNISTLSVVVENHRVFPPVHRPDADTGRVAEHGAHRR